MEGGGELVFIPVPVLGHLNSTLEMAKILIQRDDRLSVTVLIMSNPFDPKLNAYAQSLSSSTSSFSNRIRFIDIPVAAEHPQSMKQAAQILTDLTKSGTRLAALVLDMFCTCFIDVANQFGLPSYIFFITSATFLDFIYALHQLHDVQGGVALKPDDTVDVRSFADPFPVRLFPTALNKVMLPRMLGHISKFKEAKGILVNTFLELEPRAVQSLLLGNHHPEMPPVYPVGPVLNLNPYDEKGSSSSILEWLDEQPRASVVFLCFGSMGSFDEEQVVEIARALEKSGHRFLWSLRKPQGKGVTGMPTEYTDGGGFQEVLPEGFLERTGSVGKVIGWAPQGSVLAHPAVGGFVSHCGWNSVLESVWSGVPIAAWPMYAEQQLSALAMVVEFGVAEEVQIDYQREAGGEASNIVSAERIESGIRKVMEGESEVRRKVREVSEASKKAMLEGGSSYISLGRFIDSVVLKMP